MGEPTNEQDSGPIFPFVGAGQFILDQPDRPAAWWGNGSEVLAAEGEALIIVGGQGLGKSTLAQQLALGRAGFTEYADLLGYPVTAGAGRVLYLAMDRPRQIARSLRRMVGEAWRDELDQRLLIWPGPPPADLAKHPRLLTDMCAAADADTVIVDSLKDAAVGLNDDEVGASWNLARQHVLRENVEVLELHHNRKIGNGATRTTASIEDVYGSTWITSGAGSVIVLTGDPGDPVVKLWHVKQPLDEAGPFEVLHDRDTGRSSRYDEVDLVKLARTGGPLTAAMVACHLFDTQKPTAAQKQKARRKLAGLVSSGHLIQSSEGDASTQQSAEWTIPAKNTS